MINFTLNGKVQICFIIDLHAEYHKHNRND